MSAENRGVDEKSRSVPSNIPDAARKTRSRTDWER